MHRHRRNWTTVIVVLVLVTAGSIGFATMPPEHFVSVGGQDIASDKQLNIVAREKDGVVTGNLTDRFSADNGGGGMKARLDCLFVNGNDAWVSGQISNGNQGDVDLTGLYVVVRVRDNGISANDPPDQISFVFILNSPFDCSTAPNVALFDQPTGQVTVR